MENNTKTVLVLGANGKTGSRVAAQLENLGINVRRGSRNATPAFDWEQRATLTDALANVDSVYITFQPDLAVPGADTAIAGLIDAAKAAGVQQLILLSGRGEPEALRCEQLVVHSGVNYTIIRASWFNQNFSEGVLAEPVMAGFVALPTGGVKEPFIDADDIAEIAVAAITDHRHRNKTYEVTGPRLLTFAEAIGELAAASGKQIQYTDIPLQDYLTQLRDYQVPEDAIALLEYLFGQVLDGRNASVTDGVQQALGKPARDFSAFARRNAPQLVGEH